MSGEPDCIVCGQPKYKHSGAFCPMYATYRPKPDTRHSDSARDEALENLEASLGRLVSLYDASDFQWAGTRGFADSIDNGGRPYCSSALATAIDFARAALKSNPHAEREG